MQAVGANGDVLKALSDDAGCRVLFSYGVGGEKGMGRQAAENLDRLCEGPDMTAITLVKGTGYMFGLQSGLPFRGETWENVRKRDLVGRLAAIRDAATAARLIEEADARRTIPLEDVYYLGAGETPDNAAPAPTMW